MNHINSCIVDSTDTRMIDLIEAGYSSNKLSKDPQSLACIPSVRHFGNGSAVSHELNPSGNCTAFRDNDVLDESLVEKQLYDRSSAFLKCDGVAWEDFVDVQGANESLPGTSLSLPSPAGACKFIKDEKEPSVIMDTVCTNFDSAPDLPALDAVCDTNGKPHLGFTGHESASCPPAATGSRLEGPANFLIDPNQPDHPPKPDSKCVFSGKPALNFDARHPIQQLQVYKNEVPRWQTQATPAEPQYWCQPAGLTEDPFIHNAYDGIQNQAAAQRGSTSFSSFPGVLPQRQCVICSDEASGCHYGVLTCGSCKVFFKRAVEGHHSYLCAGRNDCIVDKIRRKNCPACRLRKCYQAGMMLGGRKLKRFGALKALDLASSLMFQSHISVSNDNQALSTMSCVPGIREVQLSQQIISILENIEPDTVYADHDNSKPDVPHLLNSLNRLCEKQLLWIVRWSKNLPGFRNLHISDQMTLIQYSWMNLMVFSLGWRSFQNVTSDYLYFAPDLVLSQEQMRRSPIYDLCLSIQFIPQEFANLHVTREEFLCMKAIILLNTVPLEGLKSQGVFEEMRQNYIRELTKAIHMKEKGLVASSQRFYHLTKLMDAMHDIVKKINLYCLSTFIQADAMHVEFPEMMTEVIASQLPKVLAGMVRPLLFHTK